RESIDALPFAVHLLIAGWQGAAGAQGKPAAAVMVQGDLAAVDLGGSDACVPRPLAQSRIAALATDQVHIQLRTGLQPLLEAGHAGGAVVFYEECRAVVV